MAVGVAALSLAVACNGGSTARETADAAQADATATVVDGASGDAAPVWDPWSLQLTGPWRDQIQFVEAADDGSVLLAGEVVERAVLGAETLEAEGTANAFFLARVGPDGEVEWAQVYAGTTTDDAVFVTDMAVDRSSNDLFVTGRFMGSVDLGGPEPAAAVGDTFDFYVAKYSGADGSLVWANDYGGPAWDAGTALGVAPDGEVVVAGFVDGYVQVGGDFLGPTTGRDVFLARYASADGAHRWSRLMTGPVIEEITSLDVGADGHVLAGGFFWAQDPASDGPPPAQVARFEPDGDLAWATDIASETASVRALAADGDDAIVAGSFQGDVMVGGMPAHADGTGSFLARVAASDHHVDWVAFAGQTGATYVLKLALTGRGRVLAAGILQGSASFGGDLLDSGEGQAALLLDVDAVDGQELGGAIFGSVEARANAVAARPAGGRVLVGSFKDDIDLGTGALTADVTGDGFAALLPP